MRKSLMLKLFASCAVASTIVPIVSCSCGDGSSKTVFYTVTCHLDGGTFSGLTETTLKVVENSPIGSLPSPVKTNYIFDKWKTAEGNPLDPQEKITKNMEITASYKHLSGSNISGGSTLLSFKKDATGSDTNKWVLKDSGGITIEGAAWTIVDKTTSKEISGLTINDGVVSWNNVAVGSYTAVVTATKDDVSASSEINVIVTDNAYTLTDGASLSTAYTGEDGEAGKAWKLSKDGTTVTEGITWGVTGTTEESITAPNGKLKWTAATPANTYSLHITATVNSVIVATIPVSLVLNQTTFTVSSAISSLTINDNASGTDSNEFKLLRNGTELTSDVTWSLTCSSTIPTGSTITMDGNKIQYGNVVAGTYKLTITGKWTDATSTERSASKEVTLISASTKLQGYVQGGKTLLTFKKDATGSDANKWVLYNYSSQALTDATWTIVDKSTSSAITGLTISDGTVSWNNVQAGSYTAVITATKDDVKASVEISVIVENNAYTLTGGSSISTAYVGTAGAATNAWTLYKDGTTVTETIAWGVTGTTEESITAPNGKLTWTSATPAGTYSLNITATVNTVEVASVPVSLVLNENTYTVSSAISSLTIDDNASGTDSNEFKLLRNGTKLTSDVTWSLTCSSTIPTGSTITMDGNKIQYGNVVAGTYKLTITGKWTDATSTERSASKEVTLVSNSTKSQGIVISGKDTLLTTQSSEYTATVYPTSASTNIEWSVTGWTGTEATKPTFDTTTKNKLITNKGSEGKATIQAKDTNSGVTSTFDVQVNYPWTNSDKVWTTSSDSSSFISLSMSDLANSTTQDDITAYDINGTELTSKVKRTDLDSRTLYIGSEITNIPSNFLNGWVSFIGTISFATSSKLINIGEAFLAGCTNFNSTLTLPDSVNVIYNNFMDGCSSFNQAFTLPTNLTTIGNDFLNGCVAFNQDLTISNTIVYVGDGFMSNCNAMTKTLTINVTDPSLVFVVTSDVSYTCATETSTAACYTTGITIAGTGATGFKAIFQNSASNPYRNLK